MLSCSVVSDSLRTHGLCVASQAPLSVGILQARVLERVAMPFSRGSPPPSTLPRYKSVFSLHLFPDIALVPNAGPSGSWWEVVWVLPLVPFLTFPSLRSKVLERLSTLFYFSVAKLPTSYIHDNSFSLQVFFSFFSVENLFFLSFFLNAVVIYFSIGCTGSSLLRTDFP